MKTLCITAAALALFLLVQPACAAVVVTGTNTGAPGFSSNPGDWGGDTTVYIANGEPGTLEVTDGSGLEIKSLIIGMSGSGSVTVDGGGITTSSGDGLVVGNGGKGSLLVTNGGSVSGPAATIGWSTADSSVIVTGAGSLWTNDGDIRLGYFANGNTLTVADSGLVKVGGTLNISFAGFETGNYLRLDGGYLALFGDQTSNVASYITSGEVQTWSGTDWAVSTTLGSFSFAYFDSDLEAESLTGYSGLGGYTILTTTAAVPEPSKTVFLGVGVLAIAGARRRRALKA